MKRKGFTLIELLAVIVILAVIALISTPMILGIIEKAKKGGAESSALGYIDAVEKTIATNMLDTNKTNIEDGVYKVSTLKSTTYDVKVKGEQPTDDSWIRIEKGQVTECSLKIGEYIINCNGETIKNGEIEEKPSLLGPTKEEATSTDTHKGIIYLDPTNLSKTCTKELAESNLNEKGTPTEVKTGCMKWYIVNDTGDTYKLLLDHNTTARIKWNDSGKNVAYEESNLYSVVQDLKTTSGWVVDPRLITTEEINNITGKTGFDSSDRNTWYFLDTLTQTQGTFTESKRSKYDWLYNNLNRCKTDTTDYGCTIEDNNTYTGYGTAGIGNVFGYWTQTTIGIAGSGSSVWSILRDSPLSNYGSANYDFNGIRPVITINKSIIF